MKNLIVVEKKVIGEDEVNAVDARGLHEFLCVRENFNEWIRRYLKEYGFVVNSDFCRSSCISSNGRQMESYVLSIDMAKELAMISKTPKGKEARRYFIECEKRFKSGSKHATIKKTATQARLASDLAANIRIAKLLGLDGNQAILSANRVTSRMHNVNVIGEFGVELITENNVQYFTPTELGKQAGVMSAMLSNRMLKDLGYQEETRNPKNKLVWKVTEAGKKHCQILDTGKKHSDGTPIQQIKWAAGSLQGWQK